MALKKKPVTGMKDIMPGEMEIRDYVIGLIKDTYKTFGFSSIETPCVEHIENLCSKQGGDNEKLIFKILKRGEKLKIDQAKEEADLVDGGLRYDLTVPLSRYYANHANELPSPFKALQMGNVWRADRPQRGRFRQFMQCDIDILGEPSNLAEIELILATTSLLGKLDFKNFTIRINDQTFSEGYGCIQRIFRRKIMTAFSLLWIRWTRSVWTAWQQSLRRTVMQKNPWKNIFSYLRKLQMMWQAYAACKEKLQGFLAPEAADSLEMIITSVESQKEADFRMCFDPTLVRGMSYYTGTIFEISMDEFGGSVGGGGRYDKMIGKFTGQDTPAVGFSIGFERIVMLLLERGYQVPDSRVKKAFLAGEEPASGRHAQGAGTGRGTSGRPASRL